MASVDSVIARLRGQIALGEPVLFMGAGFSLEATDAAGEKLPTSSDLTKELWNLVFPDTEFDPSTRLGDAYYAAKSKNPKQLRNLVSTRLTVNAGSLPDFYKSWFNVPWYRSYSLNIDAIEQAVQDRFDIDRPIESISATSDKRRGATDPGVEHLQVVHLNGVVWDELNDLTFAAPDYANRSARPDAWMIRCASDVMTRPVTFVGTELDESPLWHFMGLRQNKGGRGLREMRPGSILVAPSLNAAREMLLRELHIEWLQMSAEQFAAEILPSVAPAFEPGKAALRDRRAGDQRATYPPLLATIVPPAILEKRTEYLAGAEPQWVDVQSGTAIDRDCDPEIYEIATAALQSESSGRPLVITGTAGSGKSTSIMRLGLRLSGEGVRTYWIDEASNFEHHRLRDLIRENEDPVAILVDDADLFGHAASTWARELPAARGKVLVACAVRSTKVEGLLDEQALGGVQPFEVSMPNLTDSDIEALITTLDSENRLGILKGLSHSQRVSAFKKKAGRQLIVAMYEATSGDRFVEKAVNEYVDLEGVSKLLYGVICFVSSQRWTLNRDEILTAAGSRDNATLNALESLATRNVVIREDRHNGYRARHRFVADQVVSSNQFRTDAHAMLEGVCVALASTLDPSEPRASRKWRRFIRFINHSFLLNFLAPVDAREVYDAVETLLDWDHHFWLQRGALEVQEGTDLEHATTYLAQALSLAPEDGFVQTEWAYLLMKKASSAPSHTNAKGWFDEGFDLLVGQIFDRGRQDPYPYHVLGSQVIAYTRAAKLSLAEKRQLLATALDRVKAGSAAHPRSVELSQLRADIQTDWLMTTTEKS